MAFPRFGGGRGIPVAQGGVGRGIPVVVGAALPVEYHDPGPLFVTVDPSPPKLAHPGLNGSRSARHPRVRGDCEHVGVFGAR